jgi:hypothetical protein
MGVDSRKVLMYWGVAYTARTNSPTSCQFRSAWMPPAVAHAPMAINVPQLRRIS